MASVEGEFILETALRKLRTMNRADLLQVAEIYTNQLVDSHEMLKQALKRIAQLEIQIAQSAVVAPVSWHHKVAQEILEKGKAENP